MAGIIRNKRQKQSRQAELTSDEKGRRLKNAADGKVRQNRRIQGLDGLRGLAIISIIASHMYPEVIRGGYLGVSLFFVLTGYLAGAVSREEWERGDFSLHLFYWKRIRRIYPPLLFMLFLTMGVLGAAAPQTLMGIRNELAGVLLGYHNIWLILQQDSYFGGGSVSPFRHLWFLSIEMQFYLVWPLFFLLYQKLKKKKGGRLSGFLLLFPAVLSYILLLWNVHPAEDAARAYYGTDTRMFALFIGVILGIRRRSGRAVRKSADEKAKSRIVFGLAGTALLLMILFLPGNSMFTYRVGLLVSCLLWGKLIELAADPALPVGEWLEIAPLKWIGKCSYELYLWHYPVLFLFWQFGWNRLYFSAAAAVLLTLLMVAWFQYLKAMSWKRLWKEFTARKMIVSPVLAVLTAVFMGIGGYSMIRADGSSRQDQLQQELDENRELLEMQMDSAGASQNLVDMVDRDISDKDIAAVGDSVMLGAAQALLDAIPGIQIDAAEARQEADAAAVISEISSAEEAGGVLIIGLGTNGPFSQEQGQALLDAAGGREVYWLTVYGMDLEWQDEVNDTIRALQADNPGLHIIDWAGEAAEHQGWLYEDGIHLNESGQEAYAQLIREQTGYA